MKDWASKYVGLPYEDGARGPDKVDCWGLLTLVYAQEFGIVLPPIPGVASSPLWDRVAAIQEHAEQDWRETTLPFDGCAVGLSQRREVHHVGIYALHAGGRILHSWKTSGVIADTRRLLWIKGFTTVKFYQHRLWT